MKTQGEIESAICECITRFEQDYMGRGPKDIRTHLLGDLVVVRLKGYYPLESHDVCETRWAELPIMVPRQSRAYPVSIDVMPLLLTIVDNRIYYS